MREARADGRREHCAYLFRFVDFCWRGGRREPSTTRWPGTAEARRPWPAELEFFILAINVPKAKIKQTCFPKT
jgi:hypothetical protein